MSLKLFLFFIFGKVQENGSIKIMKNIKQDWADIPQAVRDFAPHIAKNLSDFWESAARSDDENWTDEQRNAAAQIQQDKAQRLLQDFKAAGGSDAHWNTITQVVMNAQPKTQQP
jgi:hypothetical protein